MKALASSLRIWESLDERENRKGRHDMTFSLAVVGAIGATHGLQMVPEETLRRINVADFDAVFVCVMDSRSMIDSAKVFKRWKMPLRRRERAGMPFVWAGGQGLRNPLPYSEIADLIVLGDAEDPLPELLRLWEDHGNTPTFLERAACVDGVFVPSVHDPQRDRLKLSIASDVSISLRYDIRVSLDKSRRIEVARGCRFKCPFCSLGWRTPYRENSTEAVIKTLESCPRRVHLQAGDAESYSAIGQLRRELRERGMRDLGWTGRLDTTVDRLVSDSDMIPADKRYAFGIEGVSWRLRRAMGKGKLTDDMIIENTLLVFDLIERDKIGRTCWHLMGGLPTEVVPDETMQLVNILRRIDKQRANCSAKYLEIHWQPFHPLPGTPAQWCPSGFVSKHAVHTLTIAEDLQNMKVIQLVGRTNEMAKLCTMLSRSDARGVDLIEAMGGEKMITPPEAERVLGVGFGQLPIDAPLPWDFIDAPYTPEQLRRAYSVMMRRLAETER